MSEPQLTVSGTCTSYWYWNYWGYYWGRFWYIPRSAVNLALIGSIGCREWRCVLAFSLLGGFCWLASFIIVSLSEATTLIYHLKLTNTDLINQGLVVVIKRRTTRHTVSNKCESGKNVRLIDFEDRHIGQMRLSRQRNQIEATATENQVPKQAKVFCPALELETP